MSDFENRFLYHFDCKCFWQLIQINKNILYFLWRRMSIIFSFGSEKCSHTVCWVLALFIPKPVHPWACLSYVIVCYFTDCNNRISQLVTDEFGKLDLSYSIRIFHITHCNMCYFRNNWFSVLLMLCINIFLAFIFSSVIYLSCVVKI